MKLTFSISVSLFGRGSSNKKQIQKLMDELNNLATATHNLATAIDSAVTKLNAPNPTTAQIQAAADAVNAQAARLSAAVNPPAPAPAPAPASAAV